MTSNLNKAHRDRLIDIVKARSFQQGGEVRLASGRTSSFYFNMKPTMMHPEGAFLIATLIAERLHGETIDMVGGLEMGAVPVATAVAAVSGQQGAKPLPAFFVRKQSKEHGTQALIEGLAPGESMAGKSLCVVEDVTTTGASALKAVDALRESGADVALVLTIVDRHEGASDAFAAAGVAFDAILTVDDFK